jgi:cystathionine beta-lyase/cystathionine gamma-synthase
LIIPKCAGFSKESFNPSDKTHRMLRLYVGLEESSYLIRDLSQGLAKVSDQV